MDMQGLEFPGSLPSVTGRDSSLADLDALDVDNLLNVFGGPLATPIPSFGDGAMFMQQQLLAQQGMQGQHGQQTGMHPGGGGPGPVLPGGMFGLMSPGMGLDHRMPTGAGAMLPELSGGSLTSNLFAGLPGLDLGRGPMPHTTAATGMMHGTGPAPATFPAQSAGLNAGLNAGSGRRGAAAAASHAAGGSGASAAPRADSDRSSDEADGSGRSRGGEGLKSVAIQEKNRRAQKRFRERQKAKMKDMTSELDDMTSELNSLRVENDALRNRNSILEKVLALRDEHIRVLQDEQHVFDLGNAYVQTSSPQIMGGRQSGPALLGYAPADGAGAAAAAAEGFGGPADAGARDGAPGAALVSALTREIASVKTLPSDVVIGRWKDTVRELGNLLVALESAPDPESAPHREAAAGLSRVLDAAGALCMHTAVLHPTNMQRLIAAALDDGRSGVRAEDSSRWAAVTSSLALGPDQRAQIVSLRGIFLRRMRRVVEGRRAILDRLATVTVPDRMLALQSVIAETLKVNEATLELKANLQEEHLAGMEFIGTVFKTIFTPMQKARAIVQSYPFYPDIYQIATSLVEQERGGQPQLTGSGGSSGMASGMDIGVGALVNIPVAYQRAG